MIGFHGGREGARGVHLLEGFAEQEELSLIVDGQDTSTGHSTQDVRAGTLEERTHAFLGNNLSAGIDGRLILDGLESINMD